ncbi:hypothetical protein GE09DRAFT_1185300 [Coniochaeta sp. 2T2.1]|nr:hypothetical protein GE09DRAFT_1185300 [Coniochaeta sp. 2T2.1]
MSEAIANRLRVSVMARAETEQEGLRDGDDNTLWESAWSLVASINSRLLESGPSPDPALLDIDMHDLWHRYWHGAINTSPGNPKLDRLALSIIQIREQGVLIRDSATHGSSKGSPTAREQNPEDEMPLAMTSNGARIWTDLPFLVEDMTAHWTHSRATLSSAQRLSAAQFLAHIAAAGAVEDDALCGIALVVLRHTLETPRQLGRLTATERNQDRRSQDLTVADLLPSANAWLFTTGRKLVQLSDDEWNESPADVGALGELVVDGARHDDPSEDVPAHGGFSPQRWMWWLRRLEEIGTLAERDDRAKEIGEGERSLLTFVRGVMDNMMLIAEQTNGAVARMVQAGGGVGYRPVMQMVGSDRPPGTHLGSE